MPALEALGDACIYAGRLTETIAADEELIRRADLVGDAHYGVIGRTSLAMAQSYGGGPAPPPEPPKPGLLGNVFGRKS